MVLKYTTEGKEEIVKDFTRVSKGKGYLRYIKDNETFVIITPITNVIIENEEGKLIKELK